MGVGALAFTTGARVVAQSSPETQSFAPLLSERADSADLRQRAEEAQARFERRHRSLLPYAPSGSGSVCSERIGRLCVWNDGDDPWVPEPDAPDLVQAKDRLLGELEEIGVQLPGDAWILGQRIRYLSEAARWPEATRLARDCAASDRSWCFVLEGFVLHLSGKTQSALEAFREGLASMPSEEALRWRDPGILVDGPGPDVVAGGEQAAWTQLWTLADPLYLVPGNDRESEHYARWTFSKISEDAESVWGFPWGRDHEEVVVRYGWERGWERPQAQVPTVGTTNDVIGHQLPDGKMFVPPGAVLSAPWGTKPQSWTLDPDEPRSRHVAAYAPNFASSDAQVAVLPRGASMVVAAATGVPVTLGNVQQIFSGLRTERTTAVDDAAVAWPQPGLMDGPERVGLFLVGANGEFHEVSRDAPEAALELVVPAGDYVISSEAWSPTEGIATRLRQGISLNPAPDDLATLSDLILLNLGDDLPLDFDAALPNMRPTTRLRPNERIAVGWEIFGLGWRQEDIQFELSFVGDGPGFFGRVGRLFGMGGGGPLRIGWGEPGPSDVGPWFRSVEVTLPELDPGLYTFRLVVSTPGREPLVRTRVVEISSSS